MGTLTFDITMSLNGFIAGPNQTLEEPLGEGGDRIHEWMYALKGFREPHGLEGGETNADSDVLEETAANVGAILMGRRMFSGGSGPWADDPNADGWWGDDPPFHVPVFVLTHHPRETVTKQGGTSFTFVTDGLEAALDLARTAAHDKDVGISGGADIVQQALNAGLIDEFQVHIAPLLLRDGVRLFDGVDPEPKLVVTRAIGSPSVTHVKYRVVK